MDAFDKESLVAGLSYREAGVDIDAGEALVRRIQRLADRTRRAEVLAGVGGFASLVALGGRFRDPVLVAGTDGVGTKLKLAWTWDRHDSVGQDLVAMCVNDVVVTGAEPLFFLDYFACGRLDLTVAERVVAGIAQACAEVGCALVGGETAEMPDIYAPGEYDLAGFAVGVVERDSVIDGNRVEPGDVLLGLAASGPHANGFSLIRRVLARAGLGSDPVRDEAVRFDGVPLREALMRPTRLYVRAVREALAKFPEEIKAIAHITGGGITENLPRVLPQGCNAEVDLGAWRRPELFWWLQETGEIAEEEMRRVFNCGVGMVLVVSPEWAGWVTEALVSAGEVVWGIGRIVAGEGEARVHYLGAPRR
ncbi:MAG: phosphoribosylformylglycinamidine cyclo-ligase [Hydrogenophilus sp.]|nr:phosphoribosylformylglycinamidine cyclo-ligase [Hydrogenophilus sp.]